MSALLCKITSKHDRDFYCLNCTENKLKEQDNVCKNHDYCYIVIPKEKIMLEYNHGEKSLKIPFIICTDMESLLEKIDTSHNNPEKPSATKINKHAASGYSLFTHSWFDNTKEQTWLL